MPIGDGRVTMRYDDVMLNSRFAKMNTPSKTFEQHMQNTLKFMKSAMQYLSSRTIHNDTHHWDSRIQYAMNSG